MLLGSEFQGLDPMTITEQLYIFKSGWFTTWWGHLQVIGFTPVKVTSYSFGKISFITFIKLSWKNNAAKITTTLNVNMCI